MSTLRDQDPDYGPSAASDEKHQRIFEENARSSTTRKITAIVEKEFSQEIDIKEKEVLEIQERLQKALKTLHLLRYVVVADFYGRKQCHNSQVGEAKQIQIHPAIKGLIGKFPKGYDASPVPSTSGNTNHNLSFSSNFFENPLKHEKQEEKDLGEILDREKKDNAKDEEPRPRKIPRYVPPKSKTLDSPDPSRNARHKMRKRIIVGNISKWIPPDWREDAASHKWTMYVRGNKDTPDIDDFVGKVRFFLHPSYRPNDVVEVTSSPFCLSRRGWGEFPVRVQLHFKSALNKPMDIIHHLKLDRTYTGLQTLGSETVVDIWIYADSMQPKRHFNKDQEDTSKQDEKLRAREEPLIKTELYKESNPLKVGNEKNTSFLAPLQNKKVQLQSESRNLISELSLVNITEANLKSTVFIKNEPDDPDTESSIEAPNDIYLLSNEPKGNVKPSDNRCTNLTIEKSPTTTPNWTPKLGQNVKITHDPFNNDLGAETDFSESVPLPPVSSTIDLLWNETDRISMINRLRYLVHLDHDYLTSECTDSFPEQNITINHSCEERILESLKIEKCNGVMATSSFNETTKSNSALEKSKITNESSKISNNTFTTSQVCENFDHVNNKLAAGSSSKLQESAAYQPLKISIPPLFDIKYNKRVLVVQDDKTIPVDISLGRPSNGLTSLNAGSKVKVNIPVTRGLSLLKKPFGKAAPGTTAVTTNQSDNPNGSATTVPNLKLNTSGSVLLNMNCNIPVLKIAETKPLSNKAISLSSSKHLTAECITFKADEQESAVKGKVTLGKDKHKIQTRKDIYEQILRTIESAAISDASGLARFIIRRLPMVTADAADPEYRRLHPYACTTEEEFFGYSIAKRKALEWHRATILGDFINKKIIVEEERWSVKEIMVWARLHGYTPFCSSYTYNYRCQNSGAKQVLDSDSGSKSANETFSTTTEPVDFQKWLRTCPESQKNPSLSINQSSRNDDCTVDVETVDPMQPSSRKGTDSKSNHGGRTKENSSFMELDKKLVPLHEFVYDTAQQIGIKLVPEEMAPNVLHCAASRMIMRALECFVDDLVRGSLARAWERQDENGCPKLITVEDVRGAILNREEFDLFSNEGLGSNYRSMHIG